jgi:hydroxypyruvate isomerase
VDAIGGTVLIEPLTAGLNGRYPLLTEDDVLRLLDQLDDVGNLSLLFDTFHLGNNGVELLATASPCRLRTYSLRTVRDASSRGRASCRSTPYWTR